MKGVELLSFWCLGAMRRDSASGHVTAGRPQGSIHAGEGHPAALVDHRGKRCALVGLPIQFEPLPIHGAPPRGILSRLRRRRRRHSGGVRFEAWLQRKPWHRGVMRRLSEGVWRTVQISSVGEGTIRTLIDRVPGLGDRIEKEQYEQRHN